MQVRAERIHVTIGLRTPSMGANSHLTDENSQVHLDACFHHVFSNAINIIELELNFSTEKFPVPSIPHQPQRNSNNMLPGCQSKLRRDGNNSQRFAWNFRYSEFFKTILDHN